MYEGVEIIRVPTLGNARASLIERAVNGFCYLLMTEWLLFRDRKELSGIINSTIPPFLGLAVCLVNLVAKLLFVTRAKGRVFFGVGRTISKSKDPKNIRHKSVISNQ